MGPTILSLERAESFFLGIESDPALHIDLPKYGATAGQVLLHSKAVLEKLIHREKPVVFKIGYTHCPQFRFRNPKFGYAYAKEGWQHMLVIFVSHETVGPSFVEASLIQCFRGNSDLFQNHCLYMNILNIGFPLLPCSNFGYMPGLHGEFHTPRTKHQHISNEDIRVF